MQRSVHLEVLTTKLQTFNAISLAELKQRAKLMRRTDNKYVLGQEQLLHFLEAHQHSFDVLCIDGDKVFQYSSAYLDSPEYDTFLDHNKGRRRRFKIRFRHYHETQLYFFEIKIKGFRNETIKHRVATDVSAYEAQILPDYLLQFANDKLQKHYGFSLNYPLQHSVRVDYQRITLVAKEGAERITIDNNIVFFGRDGQEALSKDCYVIEVKSALGRSDVDKWLRRHHEHPVKRCSKYCMGVNLLKFPHRNSRFKPILRREFNHAEAQIN